MPPIDLRLALRGIRAGIALLWTGLLIASPAKLPPTHAAGGNDTIPLGFDDTGVFARWSPVTFSGRDTTAYRYDPARKAVCARADGSASGLARPWPEGRRLSAHPILTWEWNIDGTVPGGDARTKQGDDYAARVYVNFQRDDGFAWWESAAVAAYETIYGTSIPGSSLNFIWANVLAQGEILPNAFTDRARLVTMRSGDTRAKTWVRERVNLRRLYRRAFSEAPPAPHSVAIMTDADNTGGTTAACYRRLRLEPGANPPPR